MSTAELRPPEQLEHPALLYAGLGDLLAAMVPFVSAGVDRGEFVFVAARAGNIAALQAELGERAAMVRWADTQRWHPHPGTRLRALHELVSDQRSAGATRLRLAGEPLWPAGPAELIREWQRYESVLNAVLASYPATLVCLYDTVGLDCSVVDAARRTHPTIHRHGTAQPSAEFESPRELLRRWNPAALPPPPPRAERLPQPAKLSTARAFLRDQALRAGVHAERARDLCCAVNEILTNALVHGNAPTSLWAWLDDWRFVCQIEDHGHGIVDPLAGYLPPATQATGGRGLWLARQLVDLVQIVPGRPGTTVRLHVARAPG